MYFLNLQIFRYALYVLIQFLIQIKLVFGGKIIKYLQCFKLLCQFSYTNQEIPINFLLEK